MAADPMQSETLLRAMFGAEGHMWSVGTPGAFMAVEATGSPQETPGGLVLAGGGCRARLRPRLAPGARLLAFETLSSDPRGWNHGIALCVPEVAVAPSARIVTRGIDTDPLDPAEAGRPVLDSGLGQGPVRALFRPDTDAGFAVEGLGWDEASAIVGSLPGNWIVDTPVLRAERMGGQGVALHSVAQAFETRRTHAGTTPVPPGLIPVAHVFPPHPARHRPGAPTEFDPARHARFQAILARHGRSDLWLLKQAVRAQLAAGRFDPPATDRHGAAVVRVALRQHVHLAGPPPRVWLERFDRPLMRALEGSE